MAALGDQIFFATAQTQSDDWVDFEQFLDLPVAYGDDYSASATVSPDMGLSYDAETLGNDLPDLSQSTFPGMINYGTPEDQFLPDQSPVFGMMPDTPIFDDEMFNAYQPYDNGYSFRQMVESQAAADPRMASIKEKRREAAIALHLQRLCDATARDLDMSSDSNTSFSSPSWSDCMRESISPQPASFGSPANTPASAPPPAPASGNGNGGLEMVLDLNMNATTNLPKKQKPRSQAQKENYIKARKFGACEKHKKQHKRCNCLEKAAARAVVSDVPLATAIKERPCEPGLRSVLPDVRWSGVPGHDPSQDPRLSPRTVKRSISSSPEHDPSRGLCAVLPTVRTTKPSDVAGHDRNASGVLPAVKLAKQCDSPGHDRKCSGATNVSSTVKSVKQQNVAGHDRQDNTSVVLPGGKRSSGVPGHNTQYYSSVVRPIGPNVGKYSGVPGLEPPCQSPSAPQPADASRGSQLRWRPVGPSAVLSKDSKDRHVSPSTSLDSSTSSKALRVRRPKMGMLPFSMETLASSGNRAVRSSQKLSTTGLFHPNSPASSGLSQQPTPEGVSYPLEIISSAQEQSLVQRHTHSLPSTSGTIPRAVSSRQTIRSVTSQIGGMFSSVLSTISGAWYSSVSPSFASRSEEVIFNCLSFCGARMMSAKKGLQLYML